MAYAQGLNEIQDGAKEYGWDINLSEVARIWRGGCIIRAQFLLDRITEAFKGDNPPASCCSIRTSRRSSANRRTHGVA